MLKRLSIKKKSIFARFIAGFVALAMLIPVLLLSGCSLAKNPDGESKVTVKTATCDSSGLYDGQYYIWHDEEQSNIEKDINCDTSRFKDYNYNIFTPVYVDEDKIEDSSVIMVLDDNDEKIPTLYPDDKLIYYSSANSLREISFDHYYDHGYSLGLYHLREQIEYSGQYSINDSAYVKSGSSVAKIASLFEIGSRVVLGTVGEVELTYADISTIGSIKGLLQGSSYETNLYVGTERYTIENAIADTRFFSLMDSYSGYKYSYVGNGVVTIEIPEYFTSGYYAINGMGLFKYVADEHDTDFNEEIDEEKYKAYEEELVLNQEVAQLTDEDWINDNNISSVDISSISVLSGEQLSYTLTYSGIVNSAVTEQPQIIIYNATVSDDSQYGKNNAVTVTIDTLANDKSYTGEVYCGTGIYIVALKGVSNYSNAKLTLTTTERETSTVGY